MDIPTAYFKSQESEKENLRDIEEKKLKESELQEDKKIDQN